MFIILSYDINKKRVGKVMKTCRKYLVHVHRSVFEGQLTEAQLKRLKNELQSIVNLEEDAICIYRMESLKFTQKEQIELVATMSNII